MKDQHRFYEIAFGSGVEVDNLLILCNDFGFISDEDYALLRSDLEKITFQINQLKKDG